MGHGKKTLAGEAAVLYEEESRSLVLWWGKLAILMGIIFVPLFLGLDYVVATPWVREFAFLRGINTVENLTLLTLLQFVKIPSFRKLNLLIVFYFCSIGIMIAWMCYQMGGFASSYYAGICLVLLVVGIFMSWHPFYTFFCGATMYGFYLWICLRAPIDIPAMVNSSYFLVSTIIICVLTTAWKERQRLREFFLRQHLQAEKEKLLKVSSQVAHDIRSPLTSLNAVVRHWRDRLPEDDYFTLLDLSAKRLHSIANEVLDQHGPRKKGIFSLHRLLDELIGEHSAGSNGILFKKQYGEALSVSGNRDRLQRAFGNIIKNAAEAMNGKGTLSFKTTSQNDHAVVEISDTGPGMSPEVLKKVLQGGFTSKKEGHGIGMEVVREVVEGHQGKIEADSIVGRGTTFRIKLPLPDSSTLKESEEVEEGVGSFELNANKGEQIVVIDDDPSAQLQWELILRKLGLEPLTYESFEDFQKKAHERSPLKTAIVDYHYDNSELNGFQIIAKLKESGYTNVMLCTGEYWKPAVQQEAKKLGVPICPKPIPKVVLSQ